MATDFPVHFEEKLAKTLSTYNNDLVLKHKQKIALSEIYKDRDIVASLPTGYGKSVIYHLLPKVLEKDSGCQNCVLVLCPLNIIQKDQLSVLHGKGITSCRLDVNCIASIYQNGNTIIVDIDEGQRGLYSIAHAHHEAPFRAQMGKLLLESVGRKDSIAAIVIDECHKPMTGKCMNY